MPMHCKKYPYIHSYFVASFHILMEPVPYTFVSINGPNNEAQTSVGPGFIIPSIYGYKCIRNQFHLAKSPINIY